MIIIGITNRGICKNFYDQIRKISKSNINYLILREKDLNGNELFELSFKVKEILNDTNIKLIINSNIEVAKEINADGIQLSFKDFINITNRQYSENIMKNEKNVDKFKSIGYKYRMIGVSIHSLDEGIQAYNLGADYVIYGHVFETNCKEGIPARGVNEIKELSKKIDIPIIGLGGISKNNFKEVIDSGAKGIAIMSSLMKAENPSKLIKDMSK